MAYFRLMAGKVVYSVTICSLKLEEVGVEMPNFQLQRYSIFSFFKYKMGTTLYLVTQKIIDDELQIINHISLNSDKYHLI